LLSVVKIVRDEWSGTFTATAEDFEGEGVGDTRAEALEDLEAEAEREEFGDG
jgi:hypothetical protein